MLLSEWNMDEALEVTQEEAFADGVEQGQEVEREKNIRALEGLLEPGVIAEKFELPLDYVLKVLEHSAAYTMQVREPDVEYVAVKK